MRKKQWMALFLCAGISVTSCPVPGAQGSLSGQEETQSSGEDADTDVNAQSEEFLPGEMDTEEEETEPELGELEQEAAKEEQAASLDDWLSYIREAAACQELDLSSEIFANFVQVSDAFDAMTQEELAEISQEDMDALESVRDRIAQQISSAEGVTVMGNPWYVQIHVQEDTQQ